jgi:hypothetical protein
MAAQHGERGEHGEHRYATFAGLAREQTPATAGQVIALRWTADVTKGSLEMEVKDAQGRILWRVDVPAHQTRRGTALIRATQTGQYQIIVTGLEAGGSFDVSWPVP